MRALCFPLACLFICAAVTSSAAETPGRQASAGPDVAAPRFDASGFARHLETEVATANEAIRIQGEPLQALLVAQPGADVGALGRACEAKVQQLQTALPELVRANSYLFEEFSQELDELGRLAHAVASAPDAPQGDANLRALRDHGPGLADRLRAHLRLGLTRLGERLGAPPALIVSGGASVGSYQAGFLYYYTLFLQDRARLLRDIPAERRAALRALGLDLPENPAGGFTLVTGASAGSVNALLAGYSGCREPERVPTRSLFFETWNTLSLEQLLDPTRVQPDHMFSSKPIEDAIARIKSLDPSGWRQCRFSLGVTTTRLERREIDLSSAGALRSRSKAPIRLARFTEKFLLTSTGGDGRAPEFCPFPSCDAPAGPEATFYPRLARPPGQPVPLESVFGMIAASGAFPTAFAPRAVAHSYYDSATGTWINDDKTRFADGGIYNNNPLGLAVRMSRSEGGGAGHHRFLYFDPNAIAWRWPTETAQHWAGPGVLATFEDVLKGFVESAVTAQLMDTLEAEPEVRDRLDVPLRHGLLAGEHLLWMSAFLDEDFRTYDFHRGMVDAWHFLTQESDNRVLLDELARAQGPGSARLAATDSPLFDCFVAFERSDAAEPLSVPECQKLQTDDADNIRSLMAISRKMGKDPTLSEANKFERFTDALAERNYVFRSGLLKGQPASALRREFRRTVGASVEQLAQLQPPSQRLGFEVASKLALDDAVTYAPVPFYLFAGFTSSGVELAASPALASWNDKEVRFRGGGRVSFNQAAPLREGDVTPAFDVEGYAGGTFAMAAPALKPLRLELGLGVLSTATYLWKPSQWVSIRFAAEGSIALVAAEHIEVAVRPRVYFDLGQDTAPLYIPVVIGGPPRHLNAVEVLLGAGWRF